MNGGSAALKVEKRRWIPQQRRWISNMELRASHMGGGGLIPLNLLYITYWLAVKKLPRKIKVFSGSLSSWSICDLMSGSLLKLILKEIQVWFRPAGTPVDIYLERCVVLKPKSWLRKHWRWSLRKFLHWCCWRDELHHRFSLTLVSLVCVSICSQWLISRGLNL